VRIPNQLASHRAIQILCVCLFAICSVRALWAQSTNTGTVAGTITDQSNAVVNNATVTLTDNATKNSRAATTNETGRYIFVDVAPGTYELTVTKQGFSTSKAQTTVQVGLATTANMTLQVGGSNVVVEVTSVGNDLQTMNATVGNTITSAALDALPSIGRDVSTFVELQPGVSPEGSVAGTVNDQSYFSLDGGNNTNDMDGNMSTYTTTYAGDPTGGVAAQNTFYLTGQPTGVMPTPQDSVEEFKVNTAGQTADFNSSSGAEVKVVTKRGTNTFHGTAYDYYLDNNWSSNSWQSAHNLPTFHYNRFGGSIGGPLIPKEVLGGKTYFFFNYEGFRWPDNSVSINRDVPSPAFRLGLLTDSKTGAIDYNLNNAPVLYNGKTYAANYGCSVLCDPRSLGLNPLVAQIWQKYEPASNFNCINSTICDGANVLGFTSNVTLPQKTNFMVGRIDHDFSQKWHLMSSYRYFKFGLNATSDQVDIGGFFPGDTLGTPVSRSSNPQQAWFWVVGLTTNISPNFTNDFHYSFLRNWWQWGRAGDVPQLGGLGGALEIGAGESHLENLGPYNVNTQQTRTRFWDGHDQMFRDDLSLLKGNHLFQFGGQYQHNFNWHQRTDNGGGINYQPVYQLGLGANGSGMASPLDLCNNTNTTITNCDALTAAALGVVSISQIAYTRTGANLQLNPPLTPAFDQSTIPYYNVYFSDTWHMKPTFTLTYGLGWTLEMPPVEKNGKQVEFVDAANQLIDTQSYLKNREKAALAGQVYNPVVGFNLVGNTENGRKYPYNPYYGEFSPRVAAAWNPRFDSTSAMGKIFGHEDTVVRGGYGRVFGRLNGVDLVLVPLLGTGLIQPVQCFNNLSNNFVAGGAGGTCSPNAVTFANAFRIGTDGLTAPIPQAQATLPQPDFPGINAIAAGAGEALDPHFRPNVVDSFDFTIQRQLSHKLTLELGYIGRRITREYQPININAVPYMMTLGGQRFDKAYASLMTQLGCTGNLAACGGAIPAKTITVGSSTVPNPAYTTYFNSLTPQNFFENAVVPSYCKGSYAGVPFTSCTAAVATNEAGNFTAAQVWSLWSDLDNGAFNSPRSMMNTPFNCPTGTEFGCGGQLSSGVGINASVGHGDYNAGFVSLKMTDWKGVTMQSNFTWSKALGTGALVQATSGYSPDDPFNLNQMYGRQFYDRKFVYNTFIVYSPPFFKGQQGLMGRMLGGWTFSTVFTTGSGQPLQVWTSGFSGQEFGGMDAINFNDTSTAIQIAPVQTGHAYSSSTPGNFPNIFKNPTQAFNSFRNPILGIDTRSTDFVTGLPYWNVDFSIRKDVRLAERVAMEFQGVFTNIFNHNQWLDPPQPWGLFSQSSFGLTGGSAQGVTGGNRTIQVAARVRF
jgi:Carboxypeptidase regulatory-like domain